MFTVSGILSDKSLVKTGVSEHGAWKITQFLIEKTRRKKKIKIPITAKGALANKIDTIAIGERLTGSREECHPAGGGRREGGGLRREASR